MVIIANIQEDLIKCTCNDNIIEEIEKARNNGFNIKTYWYCNILFSQTGTKLIKSIKPVEVIPVLTIGRSGFYINYYDIKKNKVVNLDFLRLTIGAEIYYLFETKEEAIEEWNRQVEITKDKVQFMYEKTIKYIESKKIKL